jgi:hypothetical protein
LIEASSREQGSCEPASIVLFEVMPDYGGASKPEDHCVGC